MPCKRRCLRHYRAMEVVTARDSLAGEDAPRAAAVWTATGCEVPVFFDHRGHRRRWVAGSGGLAVLLAVAWVCGLVGGAVGFGGLPRPADILHAQAQPSALYVVDRPRHLRAHGRREVDADGDNDARRL